MSDVTMHNLSVGFERLGVVNYTIREYDIAEQWYLKALEIRKKIEEEKQSMESAFQLSCIYLLLGDCYIRKNCYEKADIMYEFAIHLRKKVFEANSNSFYKKGYAEAEEGDGGEADKENL